MSLSINSPEKIIKNYFDKIKELEKTVTNHIINYVGFTGDSRKINISKVDHALDMAKARASKQNDFMWDHSDHEELDQIVDMWNEIRKIIKDNRLTIRGGKKKSKKRRNKKARKTRKK